MGRLHEGDCTGHGFLTGVLDPEELHGYPLVKGLTGETWLALNFILVSCAKNSILSVGVQL